MVEPRTTCEVIKLLTTQGYTEDFKSHKQGMRAYPSDILVDPSLLTVEKIYRFEGETNLEDEEIIFVLSCPKNGLKGTFVVAYGPKMDPLDAHMVLRLKERHQKQGEHS